LGNGPNDLLEADADTEHLGGERPEVAERAVPGLQAQRLVEHADALAGIVERGLQQVATILNCRRGIVEEAQRRAPGAVTAAQQQEKYEPRRGGADRRRQEMFGKAHGMDVGLVAAIRGAAARRREGLEGAPRPRLAEIARHGRADLLDAD